MAFKIDTSFDSKSTHLSIKTKVTPDEKRRKEEIQAEKYVTFYNGNHWVSGRERKKSLSKENLGKQSSWVLDKNDDGSNKKSRPLLIWKVYKARRKKDLVVIRLQLLWSDRPPDHRLTKERQWIETDNATNRSISWCRPKQINIGVAVNPVGRLSFSHRSSLRPKHQLITSSMGVFLEAMQKREDFPKIIRKKNKQTKTFKSGKIWKVTK